LPGLDEFDFGPEKAASRMPKNKRLADKPAASQLAGYWNISGQVPEKAQF
jgi:hypothetical protein